MRITDDEAAPQPHAPELAVVPETLTLLHRVPRLPAMAVHIERLPHLADASVELRLLGGGHQVAVRIGDDEWIETLAEIPGCIPHLPVESRLDAPVPGGGPYEIRCTITEHSARGLAKQRDRCDRQAQDAQAALRLRGADGAAAIVCLYTPAEGHDALQWRTWRTHPASGRLLQTVSSLRLPAAGIQHRRAG